MGTVIFIFVILVVLAFFGIICKIGNFILTHLLKLALDGCMSLIILMLFIGIIVSLFK